MPRTLALLIIATRACTALLRPAARARPMAALDASKSAATIADYDAVAAAFDAGNRDHDVSQNIDALLGAIAAGRAGDALGSVAVDRGADRPVIVDLGCAGGRDLVALTARGCEAWGVEGSPAFCELARRAAPGCTVLAQDFVALDLPAESFDGAFANASLFHVPSESLPDVLRRIYESLKPGGVYFIEDLQFKRDFRDMESGAHSAMLEELRGWVLDRPRAQRPTATAAVRAAW